MSKKTGEIVLPKLVFDGIWAIMDAAMMCLKFQTQTRIVLEYDPQSEKWSISFFQPTEKCDSPVEAGQDH